MLLDGDCLNTKSLAKTNYKIKVSLGFAIDETVEGLAAVADFISELFLGQVFILDSILDVFQQMCGRECASIEAH